MKKLIYFTLALFISGVASSCHSKADQLKEQQIADSLRKDSVKKAQQAAAIADSIAKAKADSIAAAKNLDFEKLYAICLKESIGGNFAQLKELGFKTGPSFSEDAGWSKYFYRGCKLNANGEAIEVPNNETAIVVATGASNNSPYGWFQVEVFSKENKQKAEMVLKKKDKGNKFELPSFSSTKSKKGWYISVDFPIDDDNPKI